MARKVFSILIMILLAMTSTSFVFRAERSSGWYLDYYSFVMTNGYLSLMREEDTDGFGEAFFGLYDMDRDGIPELVVCCNNKHIASSESYFFTWNDDVIYLGKTESTGNQFLYAPDSAYPGLFYIDGSTNSFIGYYCNIEKNAFVEKRISRTSVLSDNSLFSGCQLDQITTDATLFQLFPWNNQRSESIIKYAEVHMASCREIRLAGWDRFVRCAMVSIKEPNSRLLLLGDEVI